MEELYLGIIKVSLFLLGVTGILIIIKRYGFRLSFNPEKKDEHRGLKKLDTVHLGYRKFVSVLEIKDRILVVGVSEKEICLLTQWKKDGNE
ncbi:MAG: flagellar biosynthetic protein FliO [Deltaproteobacteria bacterium]|nr:flagellar biosynthetic protein FliO [Deltaproteobacteria bacterium]